MIMSPALRRETDVAPHAGEQRRCQRRQVVLRGRIEWRDGNGRTRTAPILTRDLSDDGALIECLSGTPISLYRLVSLRLARGARQESGVPVALRQGAVLSAVYRVGPVDPRTGTPASYALRLLVEPRRERRPAALGAAAGSSATAGEGMPHLVIAASDRQPVVLAS